VSQEAASPILQPSVLFDRLAGALRLISGIVPSPPVYSVRGDVFPARAGARVKLQTDLDGVWTPAGSGRIVRGGAFSIHVSDPGTYRVLYHGIAGPAITVG
jgi:hypothetical protein